MAYKRLCRDDEIDGFIGAGVKPNRRRGKFLPIGAKGGDSKVERSIFAACMGSVMNEVGPLCVGAAFRQLTFSTQGCPERAHDTSGKGLTVGELNPPGDNEHAALDRALPIDLAVDQFGGLWIDDAGRSEPV